MGSSIMRNGREVPLAALLENQSRRELQRFPWARSGIYSGECSVIGCERVNVWTVGDRALAGRGYLCSVHGVELNEVLGRLRAPYAWEVV